MGKGREEKCMDIRSEGGQDWSYGSRDHTETPLCEGSPCKLVGLQARAYNRFVGSSTVLDNIVCGNNIIGSHGGVVSVDTCLGDTVK